MESEVDHLAPSPTGRSTSDHAPVPTAAADSALGTGFPRTNTWRRDVGLLVGTALLLAFAVSPWLLRSGDARVSARSDVAAAQPRPALEPLSPDARDALVAALAQDEARRQAPPEPEPAAKVVEADQPPPAPSAQAAGEAPPVTQAALPAPPSPPEASAAAEPAVTASVPAQAVIEPSSPSPPRPARPIRAATARLASAKVRLAETTPRRPAALPFAGRSPEKPATAASAPAWSLPRALQPTE